MSDYCDIPFVERMAGEFVGCVLQSGGYAVQNTLIAFKSVWSDPASATMFDRKIVVVLPLALIGAVLKVIDFFRGVES